MPQSNKTQPYHGVLCLANNADKLSSDKLLALVDRLYRHQPVNGDNIEKLENFDNIWSSRNNLEQRLIYCSIKLEGKRYLVLIDFLEKHEYQKLERNKKTLNHLRLKIRTQTITVEHHPAYTPQQSKEIQPQFHFAEDKNYHLTTEQFGTLRKQLPLLINGSAGSGKSSTAFAKMARVVLNRNENNPLRILYITANQALIDEQKELWQQSKFAQIAAEKSFIIEFLSYDELTENNTPSPEFNEILSWYQAAIKKLVTLERINPQQKNQWHKNFTKVIEEFNRLCIYSQDDYCQKHYGEKNTYFADIEQRAIIYQLYLDYQKSFNDIRYQIKQWQNNYGLIICDEAQDFSAQQLVNLFNLAENGRIIYCVDNNQSLQYAISIRHQLTDFIQKAGRQLECASLDKSFRNSPPVVNLANSVLKILQTSNKGITDKMACHQMAPANEQQAGFALLVESPEQCLSTAKHSGSNNYQIAVVATTDELIEQAKKQFPHYAVFTPDKIKGLEFDLIIAYQPLADDAFYQANEQLHSVEQVSVKKNRSKQLPQQKLTTAFHALYTTITRARYGVLFYHQAIHLPHLLPHLVFSNENTLQVSETIPQPQDAQDNEKGQIALIKKLIKQNNYIDAMDIWTRVMNNPVNEFGQRFDLQPVAASSSSASEDRKNPVKKHKPLQQLSQVDDFIFDVDKVDENYLSTLAKQKNSDKLFFNPHKQFNGLSFYQMLKQHPVHSQTLQTLLQQKEFNHQIYPNELKQAINAFNQSMLPKSKQGATNKKRGKKSKEMWNSLFELANKFKIDINDIYLLDDGFTPLMIACLFGNADLTIQILNQGCDAKRVDSWGNTALIYASSMFIITFDDNQNELLLQTVAATRIIQLNNNQSADSLVKFFQLKSTQQGKLTVAQKLLNENNNINQQNYEGNTALHEASFSNFASMVELLAKKGADVNIVNNQNITPFFIAAHQKNIQNMMYIAKHDYNIEKDMNELIKALTVLILRKNTDAVEFILIMLHQKKPKELERLLFMSISFNSSNNNPKIKSGNFFTLISLFGNERLVFLLIELINQSQIYGDLLFRLLTTLCDDEGNNSLMLIIKIRPEYAVKFFPCLIELKTDHLIKLFTQSNKDNQTIMTLSLNAPINLFNVLLDLLAQRRIFFPVLVHNEFPHILYCCLKKEVDTNKGLVPLLHHIKQLDVIQLHVLYHLRTSDNHTIIDYSMSHADEIKQFLLLRTASSVGVNFISLVLKATKNNLLHHSIANKRKLIFDELVKIMGDLGHNDFINLLTQSNETTGKSALWLCLESWGSKPTCTLLKQCTKNLNAEDIFKLISEFNATAQHNLLSFAFSQYQNNNDNDIVLDKLTSTINFNSPDQLSELFCKPGFQNNIFINAFKEKGDFRRQCIWDMLTRINREAGNQQVLTQLDYHKGLSVKQGKNQIMLIEVDKNISQQEADEQYQQITKLSRLLNTIRSSPVNFFSSSMAIRNQAIACSSQPSISQKR